MCDYCAKNINKDLPIQRLNSAEKVDLFVLKDNEGSAMAVLFNNGAVGLIDIDYCPKCGDYQPKGADHE